jgi:hypothetical protein
VVGLDELMGDGRDLRRLRLIGQPDQLDDVPVDASVGVDAVEVRPAPYSAGR